MEATNRLSSQLGVTSVSEVCALPLYTLLSEEPLIVIVTAFFVISNVTGVPAVKVTSRLASSYAAFVVSIASLYSPTFVLVIVVAPV